MMETQCLPSTVFPSTKHSAPTGLQDHAARLKARLRTAERNAQQEEKADNLFENDQQAQATLAHQDAVKRQQAMLQEHKAKFDFERAARVKAVKAVRAMMQENEDTARSIQTLEDQLQHRKQRPHYRLVCEQ